MPAKKTTKKPGVKKTARKAAPKSTKPAPKPTSVEKETGAKLKKNAAYECSVCGFRVIVDELCGCAEEHVLICCDKKMIEKKTKKAA